MNLKSLLCLPLLLLAFLAAPGVTPSAHAENKIATVDMRKLLNGYWKTKQANAVLDKRKADLRKDLKDLADGIDKAQTEYKQLLSQASDTTISDEERTRRKTALSEKTKQIEDQKTAYDQYSRQAQVQLEGEVQRMSTSLVTEIQAKVGDCAKRADYNLVFNINPDSVVYSKGDSDITDTVLGQLNAGAPIDIAPTAPAITNSLGLPPGLPAIKNP